MARASIWVLLLAGGAWLTGCGYHAPRAVVVGQAAMYPSRSLLGNLVNSKDHTELVAAIREAGLAATFQNSGPYTLFAPTDAAFRKLPPGSFDPLQQPLPKDQLAQWVKDQTLAGRYDAKKLRGAIHHGGGRAQLRTLGGASLVATLRGTQIVLTAPNGQAATITTADAWNANGILHVVDTVLPPASSK